MKDTVFLLSHAHIDLSWLWTKEETIHQICPNTFNSVLNLMDKYPFLIYVQSAAQIYVWMEKYYPKLFEKIRDAVEKGRWEIVGGSWDEHNANILCGESLVRQYLYGKRYFMEKFGVDVKVAWLPDTFGFCWTLPQIYRKCGIKYFLTHKLKWQIERMKPPIPFPYHVFWWQAPDGSKILAYHTVGGYGGGIDGNRILSQLKVLKNKHDINMLLYLFGRGDHGGGPTEDMIQSALKLSREKGFPKIVWRKAIDYFNLIEKIGCEKSFPIVNDELYVKTHRGTFTTEAFVKKNNRLCEILLLNAEKFSIIASRFGYKYPREELEEAWKKLLFTQVHDNIDGTSLEEVYEDMYKIYSEIKNTVKNILNQALKTISSNINILGNGIPIIVFNPLSWERRDIVEIELPSKYEKLSILDADGKSISYQIVENGRKILFIADKVPSIGYKVYMLSTENVMEKHNTNLVVGEYFLENEWFRVEVDPNTGHVSRIYDKKNVRDVLKSPGNVIQIFDDKPPNAPGGEPAWNMYLGKIIELNNPVKISIVEKGPVRGIIQVEYKYNRSMFIQKIILYNSIPRIDFEIDVDWNEHYKTVKIAFPLNFENDYAAYEIPFGYIERYQYVLKKKPSEKMTHPNRDWDIADTAKFEVPALKWIGMTTRDGGYTVSLINDSKYGFDVNRNVLRMTLLRAARRSRPKEIDKWTDQSDKVGIHIARYSLFPYKDICYIYTTKVGYEFNYPLTPIISENHKGVLPKVHSFVTIRPVDIEENNSIFLTALKRAEDTDHMILRFYESSGVNIDIQISFDKDILEARVTDLIEWDKYFDEKRLGISKNTLFLNVNPYEIITLKVRLED